MKSMKGCAEQRVTLSVLALSWERPSYCSLKHGGAYFLSTPSAAENMTAI